MKNSDLLPLPTTLSASSLSSSNPFIPAAPLAPHQPPAQETHSTPDPRHSTQRAAQHSSNPPTQPSSRAPGRPSALTPTLVAAIAHQITEYGMSDTAAANQLGIPASTLSRWKYLHPELEIRFTSAREDFRTRHIHEIQNATTRDGRRDWKASAWLLERIFPADYARRPGRRVSPAPEHPTWLDEARAELAEQDDRSARRQFENTARLDPQAARELITQSPWTVRETTLADCFLPAEFLASGAQPSVLPSYASYAESIERALCQPAAPAAAVPSTIATNPATPPTDPPAPPQNAPAAMSIEPAAPANPAPAAASPAAVPTGGKSPKPISNRSANTIPEFQNSRNSLAAPPHPSPLGHTTPPSTMIPSRSPAVLPSGASV